MKIKLTILILGLAFSLTYFIPFDEKALMIVWGIIGAAGAGALGLFLSKRKKPLEPPEPTPTEPTIEPATPKPIPPEEKGRKCNVCETNIPEGLNVCPSCGDTYS